MSQTHHYKLEADGTIKSVTVNEREVIMDMAIINRFAQDTPLKTTHLISSGILSEGQPIGNIGMCLRKNSVAFTVRMGVLPMRAAFTMADGVMVPDFKGGNADPEFVLNWTPPDSMRLYLLMNFGLPLKVDVQFLVAVDKDGRFYRLPLSNLYEDARLCHGAYENVGSTLIDAVSKAWVQFHKSRWQSDLANRGNESVAYSKKLFRFKPLEPEGFEQIKVDGWEALSTRVVTAFITENIVI